MAADRQLVMASHAWRGARLFGACLALIAGSAAAEPVRVAVTPRPSNIALAPGPSVRIGNGALIGYPRGDAAAARAAGWLARLVLRGRQLHLKAAPGANGVIIFRRIAGPSASEAYSLHIARGHAVIAASGDAGLLYGAVTLWQLMTADNARGSERLSPLRIEDQPRFAWRGLLVDSARHFQSAAYIERLIDWMALHKLNVLQWHLTDDQGWRIPIDGYPRLTSVGAWRVPASLGPPPRDPHTGKAKLYGGYYTRAQIRAIVAHGRARNVTVVPEIEMPSHALSAALAYPELSAGPLPPASMQSDWGLIPAAYGLDDPVFTFLETVLGQVMDLFPSRFIAVGGDEVPLQLWQASPKVQARMKALGIADGAGLENYFMRRIASFLAARGRRMVGWDEILQGGTLPADAVVTSWQGARSAAAAASAGHDVVMAVAPTLYFDNRQSELAEEPPGRGWVVALRDVYALDPGSPPFPAKPPGAAAAPLSTPETLSDAERAHIIGVQGNLWTEHIRTEARLSAMAFPRAAAVAEAGWTPQAERDWSDFLGRLPAELARFSRLGLEEDQSAFALRLVIHPEPGGARLSLSNQTGAGEIRYRLDGHAADARSSLYQAPVDAPTGSRLSAAVFVGQRRVSPPMEQLLDVDRINTRRSQDLELCPGTLPLNLEGAGGDAFIVEIMKPCWLWRGANLEAGATIRLSAIAAPNNLQLGPQAAQVERWPASAAGGAFEVRLDQCDTGPTLATAPLPANGARATIVLAIPAQAGSHDLCFIHATATERDPIWGIDTVEVLPGPVPKIHG